MATSDEAIKMLRDILMIDHDPSIGQLVCLSPSETLRRQADELDRKNALREAAWNMVWSHKPDR